jgi:predicted ester cyclase
MGAATTIRERLTWDVTPELYAKIRRLWIAHSKAEDGRDLAGLVATLSEDCVYEIIPTAERWEGHAGARSFYTSFLGAFPDVRFDLKDIVIGPQGVIEIAAMRGTQRGTWQGQAATGRTVEVDIIIHFPWDRRTDRFAGELIYYDSGALGRQLAGS